MSLEYCRINRRANPFYLGSIRLIGHNPRARERSVAGTADSTTLWLNRSLLAQGQCLHESSAPMVFDALFAQIVTAVLRKAGR